MTQQSPGREQDRDLVSSEPHELEYLARKHGISVEDVKRVIQDTGSRFRDRIEQALDERSRAQRTADRTTRGVDPEDKPTDGHHNEEAPGLRGVAD